MPLPRIRLQQRQHHRVIRVPIPGQRPPHDPRQMQIPHGHRIRRPMTPLHGLRGRPHAHPRHHLQPSPRILRGHRPRLLKPRSDPYGTQNRRGPLVVDPGPMPLPRRDQRPRARRRHHPHPPAHRPRRRHPELPYQQPPGPIRLVGRHLLLQHRRNQRLQHQPGPRQPKPRPPMLSDSDKPMPRHERARIISGTQHLRQPLQQPVTPRPPGLPAHLTPVSGHPQGPRPDGRKTCPPHRPVRIHPKRRIPGPPPQRPEHQPQIKRPVRHPPPYPSHFGDLPRHTPRHDNIPTPHGRTSGPMNETSGHGEIQGDVRGPKVSRA